MSRPIDPNLDDFNNLDFLDKLNNYDEPDEVANNEIDESQVTIEELLQIKSLDENQIKLEDLLNIDSEADNNEQDEQEGQDEEQEKLDEKQEEQLEAEVQDGEQLEEQSEEQAEEQPADQLIDELTKEFINDTPVVPVLLNTDNDEGSPELADKIVDEFIGNEIIGASAISATNEAIGDETDDIIGEATSEEADELTINIEDILKDDDEGEHHHHHHHRHHRHHHHHHHSDDENKESGENSENGEEHEHHHHHRHHHHHHHHDDKKKKKKLPVVAKIAIAFLALLLALAIGVACSITYLQNKGKNDLQNVETQTNYDEVIKYNGHTYVYNNNVVAIAFMGIDKRDINESSTIGTAGQADADLVIAIDTSTGKTKVIAIPRDTIVDVDLFSENGIYLRSEPMQLCLSYAYGDGKETSAKNVATSISRILYDVPINKYFVLDLDGIAPINDSIGGVTVKSLFDFEQYGIKVGDEIHLTGDMTERYVRSRDLDSVNASLNRTARQVQYIKAFTNQAVPAVINDFSVVSRLYETAKSYSTTNMTLPNITYLASLLLSKGVNDYETETLKGEMKLGTKKDYDEFVYAEYYIDKDAVLQTVLNTFYTQVD